MPVEYFYKCLSCADETSPLPEAPLACRKCGGKMVMRNYYPEMREEPIKVAPEVDEDEESPEEPIE